MDPCDAVSPNRHALKQLGEVGFAQVFFVERTEAEAVLQSPSNQPGASQ